MAANLIVNHGRLERKVDPMSPILEFGGQNANGIILQASDQRLKAHTHRSFGQFEYVSRSNRFCLFRSERSRNLDVDVRVHASPLDPNLRTRSGPLAPGMGMVLPRTSGTLHITLHGDDGLSTNFDLDWRVIALDDDAPPLSPGNTTTEITVRGAAAPPQIALPPRQREVLAMFAEPMLMPELNLPFRSTGEVAELLGTSNKAVSNAIGEAKTKMWEARGHAPPAKQGSSQVTEVVTWYVDAGLITLADLNV